MNKYLLYLSHKRRMSGLAEKVLNSEKLTKEEKEELKNQIFNNLDKEYFKFGKIAEAEVYISFFSYMSNDFGYDVSAIEKSLRGLTKIKKCYFLVTEETKKAAEEFKVKSEIKEIEIIKVETENFDNLYEILERIIEKESTERDKIVIDNTLGFRMITGVFYRFCIEKAIKLIAWHSEYEEWNGKIKRKPATDRLFVIEFPQLKNLRVISYVNKSIDKFKFSEGANLLDTINNSARANLLRELEEIFKNIFELDKEDFVERLDNFVNNRVFRDKEIEKIRENLKINFEKILSLKKGECDLVYNNIVLIYINKYFDDNLELKSLIFDRFLNSLNLKEHEKDDIKEMFETEEKSYLFYEAEIDDGKVLSIPERLFRTIEELKIEIPRRIEIRDRKIKLKKFEKDFEIDEKFTRNNVKNITNPEILRELVKRYELSKKEIEEIINKIKEKEGSELRNKEFSDLKNFIQKFNERIIERLKSAQIDVEKGMIVIDGDKLKRFKKIKIDDEYI